ncbi:hypothetical protein [Sphingomonas mollis]|uniref:TonB C-terminal domain-containing protein n=1 Tax=Sphingomonas mollis TaxID=2795726 RepID=A0ABS0XPQ0_9SPHN|nr:hypothetical protein [Sphingomonas sp. BT553]MBJ6122020.1 hypothetical protein [Sphingomonas sp. BT553]
MIAALLLAATQAALSPPPVADWDRLPAFPVPRAADIVDGAAFVRGEIESGHCHPVPAPATGGVRLIAPVAILVGPTGIVRQIVPQAIGCPTIEQYTVGYLLSLTRTGAGAAPSPEPGWYRLVVSYRW